MMRNPFRSRRLGVFAESRVALNRCEILGMVRVGYRSYANDSTLRNVSIGRFCSIGRGCSIGAARHRVDLVSSHPSISGPGQGPATDIGHDVWIGDHAVVMSGLSVGTGAIIGAGAIVTKDVAPYAIVTGVPAKTLRMRFEDRTIDCLLESEWWVYGDAAAAGDSIDSALAAIADAPPLPPHFAPI